MGRTRSAARGPCAQPVTFDADAREQLAERDVSERLGQRAEDHAHNLARRPAKLCVAGTSILPAADLGRRCFCTEG